MNNRKKIQFIASQKDERIERTISKRLYLALKVLESCKSIGITKLEVLKAGGPGLAFSWTDTICDLRKMGVEIKSVREKHINSLSGNATFPSRYYLISNIIFVGV